jgi:hypothetical protein
MSAPYRTVRDAILAAYASESAVVWGRMPSAGCFGFGSDDDGLRFYPGPETVLAPVGVMAQLKRQRYRPRGLSQFEQIAEGHWAMNAIRDTLHPDRMDVLDAKYTLPDTNELAVRKDTAAHRVAAMLEDADTYASPEPMFLVATVFDWAGLGRRNDEAAQEMFGVCPRTLKRWLHGRQPWGAGIICTLNEWQRDAERILYPVLSERGFVVRREGSNCYNRNVGSIKPSAAASGVFYLHERKRDDTGSGDASAKVSDDGDGLEAGWRRAG